MATATATMESSQSLISSESRVTHLVLGEPLGAALDRSKSSSKLHKKMKASSEPEANPQCEKCSRPVYAMERIKAEKRIWHKECFRCVQCNKQLTVETYQSEHTTLYCKLHFKQLFEPKPVGEEDTTDAAPPKKHQMIICESKPVELPPDVVRASDKPDLGLEELAQLDVKSRFQVFEKKQERSEEPSLVQHKPRERSTALLAKLAKFKAKGMDVGVSDEYLNGVAVEPSSSEPEDEDGDEDSVLKKSYAHTAAREQAVSFCNMSEIVGKFEAGQNEIAERHRSRKQEIQNIRSRLFMGKQAKIKEMYEQSVMQSEQGITSADKISAELPLDCEKARAIKARFEGGFNDENQPPRNRDIEDKDLFNDGIGKKSRSIFLELDANAKSAPPAAPAPPAEPPRRKEIVSTLLMYTQHKTAPPAAPAPPAEPPRRKEIVSTLLMYTQHKTAPPAAPAPPAEPPRRKEIVSTLLMYTQHKTAPPAAPAPPAEPPRRKEIVSTLLMYTQHKTAPPAAPAPPAEPPRRKEIVSTLLMYTQHKTAPPAAPAPPAEPPRRKEIVSTLLMYTQHKTAPPAAPAPPAEPPRRKEIVSTLLMYTQHKTAPPAAPAPPAEPPRRKEIVSTLLMYTQHKTAPPAAPAPPAEPPRRKEIVSTLLMYTQHKTAPPAAPAPPAEPPRRKEIPFIPKDVVRAGDRPEEVPVQTAAISDRFQFFETYRPPTSRKQFRMTPPPQGKRDKSPSPEVYHSPDVTQGGAAHDTGLAAERHTASRMIGVWRQMEEHRDEEPQGPKPLKRFTPPPPGAYTRDSSEYSSEDSGDEDSEDAEDSEDERRRHYVQARERDEALKQAQQLARTKSFRDRFENWSESEPPRSPSQIMIERDEEEGESQLDTAKSLRAKFENMNVQQSSVTKVAPKVNRFVVSALIIY
ncbi:unnamed protein product [Plutella xylostella]|uniref:(diamondback moth) hypothetical protein n=1 Tax=Plutella xylostella TaxID=51655 RepID=A0A8S4GA14_PLUXY|nr:unnamed protein product [Plutella xylostella]